MGGPEVVILIVLGLIILLPLLMKAAGRADLRRQDSVGGSDGVLRPAHQQPPLRPTDLPGVRTAITRGDWEGAVDLYHRASGLPRAQAESAVMAILEPGPNQTGADRAAEPPVSGDRSWPELPDRNRDRSD